MSSQLIKKLKENGAVIEKVPGENLYGIRNIYYMDDIWKIIENWGSEVDLDPWVSIGFFPHENIANSPLVPPDALALPIIREATSIVHYYSTLRMDDFEAKAFPNIGPPLGAPPALTRVHHGSVALCKLMERIQNPPPNYVAIYNLRSGSYICTVVQTWANIVFEIILMKP